MSETISTAETFEKLLSYFDSDREIAGRKYVEIQERLIKKFEQRGCRDPYELAVETFNRVEKKLAKGEKIEKNIYAFIHGVSKFVLQEYWDNPRGREGPIEEGAEFPDTGNHQEELERIEKETDLERRVECLQTCLSHQELETQTLFLEYFDESKGKKKDLRKDLAARLNVKDGTLKKRIHDIRQKLRRCMEKCLMRNRAVMKSK